MSKTSLVRTTSAAIVLGAGVALTSLAVAAPASANATCAPGSAAYPPGSCTAPGPAQSPSSGGSFAQFSSVPNGNAVSQNAVSGTGTSYPSLINTGQPGDSSGPNAALIAGGAALVLVALGGGVFVFRRRSEI